MRMLLLLGLLSGALSGSSVSAQSIAGEWDASYNTPGGIRGFRILFQVDGEKLTGTVRREAGDSPLAGTIKGDTVRFSYTISYNGNTLELSIAAMVKADSMRGTVDFGGAAEDDFWAVRVAKPPVELVATGLRTAKKPD